MGGESAFDLHWLDNTIVVVYFIGVIAHGLWVSRGNETADDYFLAGRNLPWYLIGFSLFASNMSGSSFVRLMDTSYDNEIVVFNYEWTAAVVLIFFALFMLPAFLRSGLYTFPEYLTQRYDRRSLLAYSAFTVRAIIFIDTDGALYAGGRVLTNLMPGFSLWPRRQKLDASSPGSGCQIRLRVYDTGFPVRASEPRRPVV